MTLFEWWVYSFRMRTRLWRARLVCGGQASRHLDASHTANSQCHPERSEGSCREVLPGVERGEILRSRPTIVGLSAQSDTGIHSNCQPAPSLNVRNIRRATTIRCTSSGPS